MTTRTFTGKGNRQVESPYTDVEAVERLKLLVADGGLKGEFPESLARREWHSEAQMAWVHILVVEHENKDAGTLRGCHVAMPSLDAIRELFRKALAADLKTPRVRMEVPGVGRIQLSIAGPASKLAGKIVVSDGGAFGERRYYGRIEPEPTAQPDELVAGAACTPSVVAALVDLALDPAGCATAFGKLTGACCFCGLPLTDARSVAMGYGPICAENFGLPWGEVKAEVDVDLFKGEPS